jgi:hypothetical protein
VNSVTITLDDNTTYAFGSEPITPSVTGVNGPDDTFFGYMAPAGRTIVRVAMAPNSSMRWDELGFIVAPDPVTQAGDFDADGDVDGADFVAWQTNFPRLSDAGKADGDADTDGDVDGADFAAWQQTFPSAPSPQLTPIPEPQSMALAMLASCLASMLLRHRI